MGLRLPLLLWRRHHTLRKTRKIASRMAAQNASLFMEAFMQENRDNIRVSLQKQLSPEVFYKIKFFHLRGRIDYNKLTFVYSMMIKLRYHSLRKKPLETLTSEDRTFINTYGKQASFIDFNALKPIIEEIYLPVERVP